MTAFDVSWTRSKTMTRLVTKVWSIWKYFKNQFLFDIEIIRVAKTVWLLKTVKKQCCLQWWWLKNVGASSVHCSNWIVIISTIWNVLFSQPIPLWFRNLSPCLFDFEILHKWHGGSDDLCTKLRTRLVTKVCVEIFRLPKQKKSFVCFRKNIVAFTNADWWIEYRESKKYLMVSYQFLFDTKIFRLPVWVAKGCLYQQKVTFSLSECCLSAKRLPPKAEINILTTWMLFQLENGCFPQS